VAASRVGRLDIVFGTVSAVPDFTAKMCQIYFGPAGKLAVLLQTR